MAITLKPGELYSFGARGTWVNQSDDEIKVGVPFGANAGRVYGASALPYVGETDDEFRKRCSSLTRDAYSMSPAALEHFSHPDVQAWMRERVKERPLAKFYCEPSIPDTVAFDDIAFVYATWANWLANGDETRWPDAMKRGYAYADSTGASLAPVTTAKQYQELFGKPAPVGMFEAMTQAIDGEEPAPRSGGMIGTDSSTGLLTFRSYKTGKMTVISLRESQPMSKNCASCGDALHETYDPSRVVDGQRLHGTCADRVERLKAEQAPKVEKPDPYTQHRLSRSEVLNRAAMDRLDEGFVSRFKADVEPVSNAGRFVHPWTCDESEP